MNYTEEKKQLPPGYAPQRGYWIVGSHKNGNFSVSAQPMQHATEPKARAEAERLASLDPSKKFIVLEIKGLVTVAQHVWE